jgi:AAA15 family ATPase/GTPase
MLGLADIKDWLKELDSKKISDIFQMTTKEVSELSVKQLALDNCIIADHFYIGKLDNKKDKSIGVYQLQRNSTSNIAVGGLSNTKIMEKSVSILIHWNTNAKETEEKAYELYYKLLNLRNFDINEYKVNYIRLLVPEPIDVGTDSKNIYERVIQATFYYMKKEE